MCSGTDKKVIVFSFCADSDGCHKWTSTLPNTISNIRKYIGVCEKAWPSGHEKIRKRHNDRAGHPKSLFEGV